jgi:cytochrome c oxidase cbb3-type subunit 3
MINNGKVNDAGAGRDKFSTAQIKVLAAYVWGFSNKTAVAGN